MSTFMVKVLPIKKLEKHPNADTLALAYVNDYVSIVGLKTFSEGDLVAYIPEVLLFLMLLQLLWGLMVKLEIG